MIDRIKSIGLLALAAIVSLALVVGCGEPVESMTGQAADDSQGEILFVSNHNVMRWTDGEVTQVTHDVVAVSPTWSPAGDRFAYIQMHEAFSELIIMTRDGEPLVQVTQNKPDLQPFTEDFVLNAAWAMDPDWSPVAEELVYVSDKGGTDEFSRDLYIWIAEQLDKGIPPYVSDTAASIGRTQEDPSYSPDGSQLSFTVRDEVNGSRFSEIWTINLKTADMRELVVDTEGAYDSAWSPNGDNIAYIQRTGETNDVWIAPLDGSEPYKLTDIGACAEPQWSPDGDQIAFMREVDGNFEIWTVDVEEDASGKLTASNPEQLITAENIDAQSGLSWIAE